MRLLQVALCLLVFYFAFHAKTAAYGKGATPRSTPSTASKLWLGGQKLEVKPSLPTAVFLWFAVLSLHGVYLRRQPAVLSPLRIAKARHLGLQDPGLFFRPPPVR